jgi:hypothetical protein
MGEIGKQSLKKAIKTARNAVCYIRSHNHIHVLHIKHPSALVGESRKKKQTVKQAALNWSDKAKSENGICDNVDKPSNVINVRLFICDLTNIVAVA